MFAKRSRCLAAILLSVFFLVACGKDTFEPQQVAEHFAQGDFSVQYTVTTHAGFYGEYQLSCEQQNDLSTVTILGALQRKKLSSAGSQPSLPCKCFKR